MRQFKCPHRLAQLESRVTPSSNLFSRKGGASVRGTQTLTHGSRHVLTEWGYKPTRHTSTEKYTNENIYARCQSSVGYLAW